MIELIDKHVSTKPVSLWVDIVLFKASWIALVLFQDAGVLPALACILLKLLCWPATPRMLAHSVGVLLAGVAMDLLLSALGVFRFDTTLMPSWLVVLWLAFALTVPRGFVIIGRLRPLLQGVCGMLGGLIGYLGGYLAGSVSFGYDLAITGVVIALCWGCFVPLVFYAGRRFSVI